MATINDDEDSVRLLLPASLSVISPKLTHADRTALIISLCHILFRLLRHPEAETKTSACKAVSGLLKILKTGGAPSDGLAAVVGTNNTTVSIVPIFTQILRDPDNEASVSQLTSLLENIDMAELGAMTPANLPVILEIAGEKHW